MNASNWQLALQLIPIEALNTLYMVLISGLIALLIGLPLGVLLTLTAPRGLLPRRWFYQPLSILVNIGRSIPFAILIVAIIPFTRFVVGTSLGTSASIVPLSVAAIPFFARLVEGALGEIEDELILAAQVMGASKRQVIWKLLIPESLPLLISGMTLTLVNLVGYSAMAGLVGGGGLGKIAIQYGYQRFNGFLLFWALVVLVVIVQLIQWGGDRFVLALSRKRGRSE